MEKGETLNKWYWKNWADSMQKNETRPLMLYVYIEVNSKWNKDLNVRPAT